MNREPKFRAYIFQLKRMVNVTGLTYETRGVSVEYLKEEGLDLDKKENHNFIWNKKECSLMMFTELKDVAGNNIYEGDIVIGSFINEDLKPRLHYGHVYWAEGHGGFAIDFKQFIVFDFKNNHSIAVVGNIYENPDFFEAKL